MPTAKMLSLARAVSNIINPFLVSLVVFVLLSWRASSGGFDALKWSLISIGVTILPVFALVFYLTRIHRVDGIFVSSRRQRYVIYFSSITCGVIGSLIAYYFKAPRVILAVFVSGLISIIVFTLINYRWKISLHTAFLGGSVAVLTVVFGIAGACSAVLVVPAGWARVALGLHSPAQVTAGALLAAAIVIAVFSLFGLTAIHV